MATLALRLAFFVLILAMPVALVAGYRMAPDLDRPEADVVIEGIVVRGETYRVEPIPPGLPLRNGGEPLEAEIQIVNSQGATVTARAGVDGVFRIGPIRVGGDAADVITIACPKSRALCMSALLPAEVYEAADGSSPVTVRWRISLPPKPAPEAVPESRG